MSSDARSSTSPSSRRRPRRLQPVATATRRVARRGWAGEPVNPLPQASLHLNLRLLHKITYWVVTYVQRVQGRAANGCRAGARDVRALPHGARRPGSHAIKCSFWPTLSVARILLPFLVHLTARSCRSCCTTWSGSRELSSSPSRPPQNSPASSIG
jgi:hypothetical protein